MSAMTEGQAKQVANVRVPKDRLDQMVAEFREKDPHLTLKAAKDEAREHLRVIIYEERQLVLEDSAAKRRKGEQQCSADQAGDVAAPNAVAAAGAQEAAVVDAAQRDLTADFQQVGQRQGVRTATRAIAKPVSTDTQLKAKMLCQSIQATSRVTSKRPASRVTSQRPASQADTSRVTAQLPASQAATSRVTAQLPEHEASASQSKAASAQVKASVTPSDPLRRCLALPESWTRPKVESPKVAAPQGGEPRFSPDTAREIVEEHWPGVAEASVGELPDVDIDAELGQLSMSKLKQLSDALEVLVPGEDPRTLLRQDMLAACIDEDVAAHLGEVVASMSRGEIHKDAEQFQACDAASMEANQQTPQHEPAQQDDQQCSDFECRSLEESDVGQSPDARSTPLALLPGASMQSPLRSLPSTGSAARQFTPMKTAQTPEGKADLAAADALLLDLFGAAHGSAVSDPLAALASVKPDVKDTSTTYNALIIVIPPHNWVGSTFSVSGGHEV